MKRTALLAAPLVAALAAAPIGAQDAPVTFAQYYECDPNSEDDLDPIVMSWLAPIYDALVEDGSIDSWGWSAHQVGGPWRRLGFFMAENRAAGLEARARILATVQDEAGTAATFLNDVCPRHTDYIWEVTQTSEAAGDGPAGTQSLSTYFGCNFAQEARADELVAEIWAPALERQVEAGLLTGWVWLAHDVGGFFRRASVFNGNDHGQILTARDRVIADIMESDAEGLNEFSEICGSHSDYLWSRVPAN